MLESSNRQCPQPRATSPPCCAERQEKQRAAEEAKEAARQAAAAEAAAAAHQRALIAAAAAGPSAQRQGFLVGRGLARGKVLGEGLQPDLKLCTPNG